jgi:predicted metalloprotease with PDZ domain
MKPSSLLLRRVSLGSLALLSLTGVSHAQTQAAPAPAPVYFSVSMPRPWTHLLEVEMRVQVAGTAPVDLTLPVWTPGSYMVREYSRNVQDFSVTDKAEKPLAWSKTRKNIWRVEAKGAKTVVARYKVYANVLTVREAEVNDEHAFWNNAAVLMHVAGKLNAPATVSIAAPKGWKVATGLPTVTGGAPGTSNFRAADFDTLYDSPFEVGPFEEIPFTVRGVPHRLIIEGKGNYDVARLQADMPKVVEASAAVFGVEPLPYTNYTFMLNLRNGGGGGLEHKNSTALLAGPRSFVGPRYTGFLGLASHEFFHLWNVKRIKPDALGPFDYSNENYTRSLWVAEGITEYYSNLNLLRAGLMDPNNYLGEIGAVIEVIETTPGRRQMSLEEASFDAWIKYYRRDENSINTQISYYDKGCIVGMLLDITIRQRTNGAKSLDDVMRVLYTDYAKKNLNYTPANFQKICEDIAGGSLEPFFTKYVRGHDELDYDSILSAVGLRLVRTGRNTTPAAYLGATFGTAGPGGVTVSSVREETPAYDQGLSASDIIIAVDGERVQTSDDITNRIAEHKPGETVRLTLFRNDNLRTLEIKLGSRVAPNHHLDLVPNATEDQRRLFQGWLGITYPGRR